SQTALCMSVNRMVSGLSSPNFSNNNSPIARESCQVSGMAWSPERAWLFEQVRLHFLRGVPFECRGRDRLEQQRGVRKRCQVESIERGLQSVAVAARHSRSDGGDGVVDRPALGRC